MPIHRLSQRHIHGRQHHPFQTDHPGSSVAGHFSIDELLMQRTALERGSAVYFGIVKMHVFCVYYTPEGTANSLQHIMVGYSRMGHRQRSKVGRLTRGRSTISCGVPRPTPWKADLASTIKFEKYRASGILSSRHQRSV